MSAVLDDMETPPVPDSVTNGQLYLMLQRIHTQQLMQRTAITQLEKEFAEYKVQHEDMVRTWSAAKTMMTVIKALGGAAIALSALYVLARTIVYHLTGNSP